MLRATALPRRLQELLHEHESATAQRAMAAMLKMKKIDITAIEHAAKG